MPYCNAVKGIACHIKRYFNNLQSAYDTLYYGKGMYSSMPSPIDRTHFWLSDDLPFASINIGDKKRMILRDLILLPIGISRTFSLSMAIHPIIKLRGILKIDQQLELYFVVILLSSELQFNDIMKNLIDKYHTDKWNFQLHPCFDWYKETIDIYGKWQGGPYQRWSPSGIENLAEIVGPHLDRIVQALRLVVKWIDSLSNTKETIPFSQIKESLKMFCDEINEIVNCEFGLFRLEVFITMINACGITKSGTHLRQLFIPVKNTASWNHLVDPTGDAMSFQQAETIANGEISATTNIVNDGSKIGIDEKYHDDAMKAISEELGFTEYFRDIIECSCCESKHSRNLHKKECYCRGCALFDIDKKGRIIIKDYGKESRWVVLPENPSNNQYAYLTE